MKNGNGDLEEAIQDSVLSDSSNSDKIISVPVETVSVHRGSISSYLIFNSTLETEEEIQIFPQISGMVNSIVVEEGDRVQSGDTLLFVEDEQLRITYKEAETNLDFQEANFRRNEEMFRRKLISDQEYETKKFELSQARLRYARAKLELEHSIVIAPFSGVITERHVQIGARVGPSNQLFDLIKLDDMIVRIYVPGQYLSRVNKGQIAEVTTDFLPERYFSGWVKRISPVVDPNSGTFKVTVGINDKFESLRPGMFVSVRVITDIHHGAILIPKNAIVYDGGDQFVFVVRDSIANRIPLNVGYEELEFVESLTGIDERESVIVVGQNGLKDGARVKVVGEFIAEIVTSESIEVKAGISE